LFLDSTGNNNINTTSTTLHVPGSTIQSNNSLSAISQITTLPTAPKTTSESQNRAKTGKKSFLKKKPTHFHY